MLYLPFRKAFNTVSHNILTDKLKKGELDKLTVRGTENLQSCYAQRLVVSRKPPTNGAQQVSVLEPTLCDLHDGTGLRALSKSAEETNTGRSSS